MSACLRAGENGRVSLCLELWIEFSSWCSNVKGEKWKCEFCFSYVSDIQTRVSKGVLTSLWSPFKSERSWRPHFFLFTSLSRGNEARTSPRCSLRISSFRCMLCMVKASYWMLWSQQVSVRDSMVIVLCLCILVIAWVDCV